MYVTKLCVTGRKRRRGGGGGPRGGCRSKNKNPTQFCGEQYKKAGVTQGFSESRNAKGAFVLVVQIMERDSLFAMYIQSGMIFVRRAPTTLPSWLVLHHVPNFTSSYRGSSHPLESLGSIP